MDWGLDLSEINLSGDPDGISPGEIISVLVNNNSRLVEIGGYPKEDFYNIETGYSNKKRILMIASRTIREHRQVLQVKVADEIEIENYYCKG